MPAIKPAFGRFQHPRPTYKAHLFFVSFIKRRKSLPKSPLQQWPLHSPSYAFVMVVDDAPQRHG
jgi:hypothetical protein